MASLMWLLLVGSLGSVSLENLEMRDKLSCDFINTIVCQELGYIWTYNHL